jgi:hypothetical protein
MTVKENTSRLQRRAHRLDMYLSKSRARDSYRPDFGRFALIDVTNAVVCGGGPLGLHSCTLIEIDEHLARLEREV